MNRKLLYPLSSAILSSFILLFSEFVFTHYSFEPFILMSLRLVIGGTFLLFFVEKRFFIFKETLLKHPFLLLASSLFLYFLPYILSTYAFPYIGATKYAFSFQLETLFIVFFAFVFLKEKMTTRSLFAGGLILLGGLFLNFSFADHAFSFEIGDIFAILTPFCTSLGVIILVLLLRQYRAVSLTAQGFLIAGFSLLALSFVLFDAHSFLFSLPLLFWLILLGLLDGIDWLLYNKGLELVGASITSILFATVPFFSLLVSYFFNEFVIADFFILPKNLFSVLLGGILMFVGVFIVYDKSENAQNTIS